MADLKKLVQDNFDFLVETRKHFHRHPELSSQEFETAAYIKSHLNEWGIPYETTGVSDIVATITGSFPGKTVAMRGDIDALPITEATGVDFASENPGVMHACGHDIHATYMLGAAKILKDLKDEIHGTVKIIFQEGEEIGAGARKLMETDILDGVDNIVGVHNAADKDLGIFSLNYGVMSSYGSGVTVTVARTDGAKGNPLLAAADLVNTVTSLATQQVPGEDQGVLVPTVVSTENESCGFPKKVVIQLNFRTLDVETTRILNEISDRIAKGIETSHGVSVSVTHVNHGHAVNNDRESTDRAARVIAERFGEKNIEWAKPSMGGEDFSLYQEKIPGVFVHVGGVTDGVYRPQHTDKTLVDEKVLLYGLEFLLAYAFDYLNDEKAA